MNYQIEVINYETLNLALLKEFIHRSLFVRFVRPAKTTLVEVYVDCHYIGGFHTVANTKEEFATACTTYREDGRYEDAYEKYFNRVIREQ